MLAARRPDRVPELLAAEAALRPDRPETLTGDEIRRPHALAPRVAAMCEGRRLRRAPVLHSHRHAPRARAQARAGGARAGARPLPRRLSWHFYVANYPPPADLEYADVVPARLRLLLEALG